MGEEEGGQRRMAMAMGLVSWSMPRRGGAWLWLALAIGCGLCLTAPARSLAAPGLVVVPSPASGPPLSYFKISVHKGHAVEAGTIELRNPTARRLRVVLSPVDGQTINTLGSTYATATSRAHTSTLWLRLGQARVTLPPGQRALVPVSVLVPHKARPGDYLSGVSIEALEQHEQTVRHHGASIASVVRYAIGVEISLPGHRTRAIRFTGAGLERQPAGLVFLLDAGNTGNVILQNVQGRTLITRGRHVVARMPLGPGTFVTGTSIAYPVPTPQQQPPEGTVYRVRAYLRYAGGIARLDTLVRFGHAAAVRQQEYGGPKVSAGSGISGWLLGGVGVLAAGLFALLWHLSHRGRRRRALQPIPTLDAALVASRASGEPLSLIVVESDAGIVFSDELATALRSRLRPVDRLCHLGGGGFLVVAPATDPDVAEVLAEDLRRHAQQVAPGEVRVEMHAANGDVDAAELLRRVRADNGYVHAFAESD
jgi:GGDEF domain-containing protein